MEKKEHLLRGLYIGVAARFFWHFNNSPGGGHVNNKKMEA